MIDLNFAINIVTALGAVIARQGGGVGDSIELNREDLSQYFEDCNPRVLAEALTFVADENIVVCFDKTDYNVEVTVVGDYYIVKLV